MNAFLLFLLLLLPAEDTSPFLEALAGAEMALEFEDFEESGKLLNRALERDPKSLKAWELKARLAN